MVFTINKILCIFFSICTINQIYACLECCNRQPRTPPQMELATQEIDTQDTKSNMIQQRPFALLKLDKLPKKKEEAEEPIAQRGKKSYFYPIKEKSTEHRNTSQFQQYQRTDTSQSFKLNNSRETKSDCQNSAKNDTDQPTYDQVSPHHAPAYNTYNTGNILPTRCQNTDLQNPFDHIMNCMMLKGKALNAQKRTIIQNTQEEQSNDITIQQLWGKVSEWGVVECWE